jgi:propanol-preferring alcohol dehydrogenase
MKVALLREHGQPLVLEEAPEPRPERGQVVVRVEGAGFCHTDLHVMDGELRLGRLPMVLGHENAGVVQEVGRDVTRVQPGDRVVVFGGWGCGNCDYCVTGNEQLCQRPRWAGLSRNWGGYAEFMMVPHERYLVRLGRIETREAAVLADAALSPYRAIIRALPYVTPDYPVLVIGVGGLGQYAIKLLHLLTASPVIALDANEEKLEVARQLGAARVVKADGVEAPEQVLDALGGVRVAAAFDFVGSDSTLALAFSAIRSGGKVTQVGLGGGSARLRLAETLPFEVSFEGTLWGSIKELREVVGLAEGGLLPPIDLEFEPLERINDAADRLREGSVRGRVVITP